MMPTKEEDETMDNFMNNNNQSQSQTGGLSKAELRKSNKPIMEKKRRARINHCLNELKTLILEAMKKDPARHQKLEKADILEMTVKHLQTVQRSHLVMSVQTDPTVLHKFKSGFVDCAEEVNRVIASMDNVDVPSKQRLITHLNGCITGLQQVAPFQFGGTQFGSNNVSLTPPIHQAPQTIPIPTQDVNNNSGRIQMGGVQFIPSRLPTGELALVMPNSTNLQYFPQSTFPQQQIDLNTNYQRPSAFNTVSKSGIRSLITSPPLSPISSISSCGEDSSSEFHPIIQTPPLQQMNHHNFINTFPTPPSTNTSFKIPSSSLQQSHISSTTTTEILSQQFTGQIIKPEIHYVNKKRPYPVDLSEVVQRPAEKMVKLEVPVVHHLENQENHEDGQDNMWRPW